MNILGVLKPVRINAIHQIVIFSPITNGDVIFNNKILKSFNQIMAKEKVWNVTNPFLIPNGVEEELSSEPFYSTRLSLEDRNLTSLNSP